MPPIKSIQYTKFFILALHLPSMTACATSIEKIENTNVSEIQAKTLLKEEKNEPIISPSPKQIITFDELEKVKAKKFGSQDFGTEIQCIATGSYPLHWEFSKNFMLKCPNYGMATTKDIEKWGWKVKSIATNEMGAIKNFILNLIKG